MRPKRRVSDNGYKVLVVEDSPTQATQLLHVLARRGYTARTTATGEEALATIKQDRPSLVISDIMMPGMDGYSLCQAIKSQPELSDLPVVLLTSLSGPQDVLKGLKCGADNFICKPYDEKYLCSRLSHILTNRELRKREKMQMGVELELGGQRHFITAERQQMLDLLLSTSEELVRTNEELQAQREVVERSYRTLQGLYRVADGLSQATTEKDVLEKALDRTMELPGVKAGWIALREGEGGFRLGAARGLPPALEGALEGDCQCRRKLLAGELDQVTNILECERLAEARGEVRGLGYHAIVPLWVGKQAIGVMNLAGPDWGLFKEEDLQLLYSVGNQVAVALERAQLLKELERKVEEKAAALKAEVAEHQRTQGTLRRFFEVSSDLICIAGFDGYFKQLNDAWTSTLGFSQEELLAAPYLDFVHPDDRAATIAEAEKLVGGRKTILFENRYRTKDGSYRWLFWSSTPVRSEGLIYAAAHDITERKQMELQLRQAQKMETVGQLAGGVAHDFNNLLGVISGYSEMLLGDLSSQESLRRKVEQIHKAGERATALTRQLLAFSRKQVLQPQVLDLNVVVTNMSNLLRRLIGEDIELVSRPGEALGHVRVDPGQLEQVIMNLAVNARDAMPRGGKLTLETRNVELDEAYARQHVSARTGPHVLLAVSDTGHGMDRETLAHIFEPFFTTKEKGKGTGLGLATVYGIVKQSGGGIWVYSEPGQGTTFKIYLPRVDEAVTRAGGERLEEIERGWETVLLVEDAEPLRMLARELLLSSGYTVLEAGNGAEALEVAEGHKGPIHLLLTDVVMPGMGGTELAKHLAARRPEMKVLYMSGYANDAINRHGVLDPDKAFIEKPFKKEVLERKLREVLQQTTGSQDKRQRRATLPPEGKRDRA